MKLARQIRWQSAVWAGACAIAVACNSLDEPGPKDSSVVVVPVDARATQQALHAPPAISGGTLAVTSDSRFAIAADPDRDRVSLVDLTTRAVQQVALEPGDEPGRVVTDDSDHAFVALRRSGDVVLIDIATASIVRRVHVCAAPRGLALQTAGSLLHVACNEGRLVTLSASAADPNVLAVTRDLRVESDLRDVMIQGDGLLVSTFKSAELLTLNAAGEVQSRMQPRDFTNTEFVPSNASDQPGETRVRNLQPHTAWRTVNGASGVFMLHQGASKDEVAIDKASLQPRSDGASAYGGGAGSCSGIVVPAITRIGSKTGVITAPMSSGVLTVDLALSRDESQLAAVQAGAADQFAPRPRTVFASDDGAFASSSSVAGSVPRTAPNPLPPGLNSLTAGNSEVMVLSAASTDAVGGCEGGVFSTSVFGQATAVAFVHRTIAMTGMPDDLVVQSREPALLTILSSTGREPSTVIDLNGESMRDTGHEIFHRDAGGGVACASCHAEGAEDGHVWKFNTVGLRRTQALHIGLEGTAPFHWNGEEADLGHLMEDVFVGRMGGVHQSEPRLSSLTGWLYSLQPPAAAPAFDEQAAERGQTLFASAQVGCTSCHSGAKLTNNQTVDVGTGAMLQVPSLRAVGYRAPFMHTGCAKTLQDRFDPACGGSKHGNTAGLSAGDVDDLVAYLKTL